MVPSRMTMSRLLPSKLLAKVQSKNKISQWIRHCGPPPPYFPGTARQGRCGGKAISYIVKKIASSGRAPSSMTRLFFISRPVSDLQSDHPHSQFQLITAQARDPLPRPSQLQINASLPRGLRSRIQPRQATLPA
jgi:hypothetical protein